MSKKLEQYDKSEFKSVVHGKTLGSGSFGTVMVGLLPSGRFVAVKQLELSEDASDDVNREVEVHKSLQHPNIIRYLHSEVDKSSGPAKLNIYLEYVTGGALTSIMKTLPNGKLPLAPTRVYARHMFLGLEYLHSHGVAHRDIKGDNILVSQDTGMAKLADFDQAKVVQQTLKAGGGAQQAKTLAGTPFWMAPEVLTEEQGYNPFKADIWSAGCTIAEMLTGKAPWLPMQNPMGVMYKLANCQGWPDAIPRDSSELGGSFVIDFLDKCFQHDASKRPDATALLDHKFLRV